MCSIFVNPLNANVLTYIVDRIESVCPLRPKVSVAKILTWIALAGYLSS